MTAQQSPPAPVMAWAERTLGPLAVLRGAVADPPLAHAWDVVRTGDGARFQVKTALDPGAFTRETFAHRHAVPALGPGAAPRLLATSAAHLALIVTAVPGTSVTQLRLTESTLRTVHWRAGFLLAQLHQAGRGTSTAYHDAPTVLSRLADEAAARLCAVGDCLSADEQKRVMGLADRLRFVGRLPLGYIHGGSLGSSLLWSADAQLVLRDFESARFAPVVLDFVHFACGPWAAQPGLRTAFFTGYGRTPGHDEEIALRCLTALTAARRLAEARALGNQVAAAGWAVVLNRVHEEVGE
ncbi:phosphotransferase [Streptomyces shenzhenensis]|uniref:phosphotransferase n=1 Tax=Streptomyces shenzhenensis TaxID=943815 RepID=UPI0015EFE541|nr:phosphotransferase [Streptomyces shenzhenensis]